MRLAHLCCAGVESKGLDQKLIDCFNRNASIIEAGFMGLPIVSQEDEEHLALERLCAVAAACEVKSESWLATVS